MYTNISSSFVRDINTSLVLSHIRERRLVSRTDLVRLTSLSYPTVSAIVKYLMDEGMVSEAQVGDSGGGRKPMLVRFVPDARYIIGVNVGGSSVQAALADLDGSFVGEIATSDLVAGETNISQKIVSLVWELQKRDQFSWDRVVGIGLSLRGSFDIQNRYYYYPGDPKPIRLMDDLEAQFPVPIVMAHNSAAAMLAEYVHGLARGSRNAAFINVDTGVSAGLLIEGQVCYGALGNAGEFGHVMVESDGEPCPECGRTGCLEGIVSISGLIAMARRSGLSLPETGSTSQNLQALARLAHDGNREAITCFDRAAVALANGIADLVNMLNPELVILGGRVVWAYEPLVDKVTKMVKERCWPYSRQKLAITQTTLDKHSFLRGAVTLVLEQVFLPREVSVRASAVSSGPSGKHIAAAQGPGSTAVRG